MGYEVTKRMLLPLSGYNTKPIQALTSTQGGVINPYGVTTIQRKTSAGASTALYTLAAPPANLVGYEKTIIALTGTSTRTCRVTFTGCKVVSTAGSTTATKITFNKGAGFAYLIALSTSLWAAQVQNGTIA